MSDDQIGTLRRLARLYGVRSSFRDVFGEMRVTPADAILALLRGLRAPVENLADVPDALRERRRYLRRRVCEPVVVAWDGTPAALKLTLPAGGNDNLLRLQLTTEEGERRSWEEDLSSLTVGDVVEREGERYSTSILPLPDRLPYGYHHLTIESGDLHARTLIISSPGKMDIGVEVVGKRSWGVFMPLYSLHSGRSWGIGDLGDLELLGEWVARQGGDFVGTLPLLETFHRRVETPSPYSPASRFFWNELYLDVTGVPEFTGCTEAARFTGSPSFTQALSDLRDSAYVDYRGVSELKRTVLRMLARHFFSEQGTGGEGDRRRSDFEGFNGQSELVRQYARFMAAVEKLGPWPGWPAQQRGGELTEDDYREDDYLYHLYVQWLLSEQLASASSSGNGNGATLYLDYPVGVPHDSFDAWHFSDIFLPEFSVGAPPDTFFRKGQNWGFPPLSPDRVRETGYGYFIGSLRNHLRYAGMLRIDHIMGLHRLYWIPEGFNATDGAYVRNYADELLAILLLEAYRSSSVVVGEDLGTVPKEVRSSMARHGIMRMFVLQSELRSDPADAVEASTPDCLASMNTHDMPLFAAFWEDDDTHLLRELGHLDEVSCREIDSERGDRRNALLVYLQKEGWLEGGSPGIAEITDACHRFLAAGDARAMMINLEDLWQEIRPQNVPGTTSEQPNWSRKCARSLEQITESPEVNAGLRELDGLRRRSVQEQ